MTIKVNVKTTEFRSFLTDSSTTVSSFLTEHGYDYASRTWNLTGVCLQPNEFNMTFAELGVTGDECTMASIQKFDNAVTEG